MSVSGEAASTAVLMSIAFRQASVSLGPGADPVETERLVVKLLAQGFVDARHSEPTPDYWKRLLVKALEEARRLSP